MPAAGIDLLLVGGFRSRDHHEHYLSNDYLEAALTFPLAGHGADDLSAVSAGVEPACAK